MVRWEQRDSGRRKPIPVANFTARIVRDLIVDDDAAPTRRFALEARCGGERFAFVVTAAEFGRMSWVLDQLGPGAIIYPGQLQHARAAIQYVSGSIRQQHIFTHTGWRKSGTDWVYLDAGGAIGAAQSPCDMQVELPAALAHYQLRTPPDRETRVAAVRASLQFLDVAPDRISCPLLAAVYRAPLGRVDFSLFLTGASGTFKTALAALCQQHFGAEMDAGSLPAHFSSTANALETLAFAAKDTMLVLDDFVPTGGAGDETLHGIAERLFRGAGNHQGRSRLSGNGKLHAARPPRALLLATGEQIPKGKSLRARLLIIPIHAGEVDRVRLSECQNAAQQGLYALAMGGFVKWTAERYEELQAYQQKRVQQLRAGQPPFASHARLPTTLAELQNAWEIWLRFAGESAAIGAGEQEGLEQRARKAFAEVAAMQPAYQISGDPALQFLSHLRAALASGVAHMKNRFGETPDTPFQWGWRLNPEDGKWIG